MADFVFPQPDAGEFEAPNGLTYAHDGTKSQKHSRRGDSSGPGVDPDEYLKKSGGMAVRCRSLTLESRRKARTFSVKSEGLGDKPVSFRVTADGGVKAGHDTSHPFVATSKNDVVTKAYTDAHAAAGQSQRCHHRLRIKCDSRRFSAVAESWVCITSKSPGYQPRGN